ncbi:MAG: HypC/HybG/HupF family hydrogenase formation chaperone [Gemmatimonadota bacterium]
MALPGRVIATGSAAGTAAVALEGVVIEVALDLLDDVAVGEEVLVHQGFAIGRVAPP